MTLIVETRKPRLWVVCSRVYSKVRWLETRNQALGPFPVGLTGLWIHVACKRVKHSARGRWAKCGSCLCEGHACFCREKPARPRRHRETFWTADCSGVHEASSTPVYCPGAVLQGPSASAWILVLHAGGGHIEQYLSVTEAGRRGMFMEATESGMARRHQAPTRALWDFTGNDTAVLAPDVRTCLTMPTS